MLTGPRRKWRKIVAVVEKPAGWIMADPFFRGLSRMDWLVAVLLQYAADWGTDTDVATVGAVVGMQQMRRFSHAGDLGPDVVLLQTPDYVFVLCASTHNQLQWIGNILGSPAVQLPDVEGRVSGYFGSVAAANRDAIASTLAAWAAGRRVVVAGFSLGSASGNILYQTLSLRDGYDAAGVFFGPPRPGLADFAAATPTANVSRFTLVNDPVGSVPPLPWTAGGGYYGWVPFPPLVFYAQPGDGYTLGLGGEITPGDWTMGLADLILSFDLGLWQQYHSQYLYALNLRRKLPATLAAGYEGFAGANLVDAAAASIFSGTGLTWPWAPSPSAAQTGASTMPSLLSVFFKDVDDPIGFTESYVFASTDPSSVLNLWNGPGANLESKRLLVMSGDVHIYAVRCAQIGGAARNSKFQKYPTPKPGQRTSMDRIEASIAYFGFDATGSSKRQFHFRGIASTLIDGDRLTPDGEQWLPYFEAFLQSFKDAGGALFKPAVGAQVKLQTAVQAVAGGLITLTTDVAGGFAANDVIMIRGCKENPLLNGRWRLAGAPLSPTSFLLGGSGRYSAPASISGTVQRVTGAGSVGLTSWQFDGTANKKCGKPAFLQRGRRSPQLRHR